MDFLNDVITIHKCLHCFGSQCCNKYYIILHMLHIHLYYYYGSGFSISTMQHELYPPHTPIFSLWRYICFPAFLLRNCDISNLGCNHNKERPWPRSAWVSSWCRWKRSVYINGRSHWPWLTSTADYSHGDYQTIANLFKGALKWKCLTIFLLNWILGLSFRTTIRV